VPTIDTAAAHQKKGVLLATPFTSRSSRAKKSNESARHAEIVAGDRTQDNNYHASKLVRAESFQLQNGRARVPDLHCG
jgi:hypothetical protein